jgi:hypothetical protein
LEVAFPMTRVEQPGDGDELAITRGWLLFHRDALAAKCAGLGPDQLVAKSCSPSKLTLLGLVRHMTEMERVYGVFALGPEATLELVYGTYEEDGPEWDFDVDESMVDESFANWEGEKKATDQRIASFTSLDTIAPATGRTFRWSLQKLIGEYARHNGHADLIREGIDGITGE